MSQSTLTAETASLLQPMLKLRLYAAISKTEKPMEEILPFVPDHLSYMMQLEKEGILFASGPFIEPGILVGAGLTILRAENRLQAKSYLDEEPLVKRGMRSYQLFEWELREGCMNVKLDFSTGKYQFT